MLRAGRILASVVVWFALGVPANAQSDTFKVGDEAASLLSMSVISLRERNCGGEATEGSQNAKNSRFIGCVMYVLGVVDMLRELQKIDPTHAPPACVPRNTTSGQLIVIVHDHIEATAPWREGQNDATTAVIGALKAKWPCSGTRR